MTLEVHISESDARQYLESAAPHPYHSAAYREVLDSIRELRSLLVPDKMSGERKLPSAATTPNEPLFGAFLRSSPEPKALCSTEGLIHYLNPAAQRLFGYNADEITGHKFASLLMPVPPDDVAVSQAYWDSAASRGTLKARRKSGEIFSVELLRCDLRAGERTLLLISFTDTSCKQRLQQRINDLQQELSHLSRYMVLGELASAIAHELNQPLAAIITYVAAAQQVSRARRDANPESNLALLDKISAQATRCGDIIHKLKRLVSDRGIDPVYDDLCATVQEAVQFVSIAAAKHNIEITIEVPPQPVIMLMDRSQLFVLVSNLVKNAIDELSTWRHKRKIEVALRLLPSDMAELTVADSGPGILSSAFENMFDPFHTTKPDGNGMGLALSRRIAEAHSGRLAAANRPGGGAVFSFMIPVGKKERVGNDDASIAAYRRR